MNANVVAFIAVNFPVTPQMLARVDKAQEQNLRSDARSTGGLS